MARGAPPPSPVAIRSREVALSHETWVLMLVLMVLASIAYMVHCLVAMSYLTELTPDLDSEARALGSR